MGSRAKGLRGRGFAMQGLMVYGFIDLAGQLLSRASQWRGGGIALETGGGAFIIGAFLVFYT